MPELPEVENIAIGLRRELTGKRIVRLSVFNEGIIAKRCSGGKTSDNKNREFKGEKCPNSEGQSRGSRIRGKSGGGNCGSKSYVSQGSWASDIGVIEGQVVVSVVRRAKRLIVGFSGGGALLFQLGMTGQLVVAGVNQERARHTHLVAEMSDGRELRFVDIRRFGRVWVLAKFDVGRCDEEMMAAGLSKLGVEPLVLKLGEFRELLKSKRAVKTLLLDQKVVAGLGNIYTDEVLFAGGVHPLCLAGEISPERVELMLRAMKRILRKSIKYGGTTFSDYRNAYGQKGEYKRFLQVYGRQGERCYKCGTVIEKIKVSGRGSCFCPQCQAVWRKRG